ncbi:hypothetical protein [Planctomicrobium sp. SH664]|uniref:hypothetical protein n=1 Tax=Planctomicrobium sp. SH664 TaxID=3448125 RepID=UPI003F5AF4A7
MKLRYWGSCLRREARLCLLVLWGICWTQVACAQDEPVRLAEPQNDQRVFATQSQIATTGKVLTAKVGGGKDELPLTATADFRFLSRRLPPAGRDAEALRAVRQFEVAKLETDVAGLKTPVALPGDRLLIVANGNREGVNSYSPQGALTRETLDLLEMPGDPLALQALLPLSEVSLGQEWAPSDWVLQMLSGVEAVETSELKCKLDQLTPAAAKVTWRGKIKGQRLGTNTTVELIGGMIFDREANMISRAKVAYTITSEIGAVNPGLEMQVTVSLTREVSPNSGQLTDALVQSIPLEPDDKSELLVFRAEPWGLQLRHARNWHLFQAVYDKQAPVAILRLVNLGSLIAQCNLTPLERGSPSDPVPLDQFEADIRRSLGARFQSITTREQIPTDDGRRIFRVAATGQVEMAGAKAAVTVPMVWIYYLVAHPDGRQASFVFSIEPELLEQLQDQDREIVTNLEFLTPQTVSR